MSVSFTKIVALFVTFLATCVCGTPAFAQRDWTENALVLANEVESDVFAVSEADWDAYEQYVSTLPLDERIDRSQELAFFYLQAILPARHEAFTDGYRQVLQARGTREQIAREEIIDAYAEGGVSRDYGAAADDLKSLLTEGTLSMDNCLLVYVAVAYLEINDGSIPDALRALQAAQLIAQNIPLSQYMQREIHSVSAYLLMEAGDFPSAVSSYRLKFDNPPPAGFPIDTASTVSNTLWMLEAAGHFEEANHLNTILLSKLHDGVHPQHQLFVTIGCANLQAKLKNFEAALACLDRSERWLDVIPESWASWTATKVDSLARSGRLVEARDQLDMLDGDLRFASSPYALGKVKIARAILSATSEGARQDIVNLVEFIDSERQRARAERREVTGNYRSLIESETAQLEQNATLKDDLLMRQTLLTGVAICICLALGIFLLILWKGRGKERILSITDPLTGLNNRRGFDEKLISTHDMSAKNNTNLAIGLIDLDGFKGVNDIYGHAIGDGVLVLVANRLRECLGSDALLGRLGGDEFAFVIEGFASHADLQSRGKAICRRLNEEKRFGEASIRPRASIGIATCTSAEVSVPELYDRADFALYSNKANPNEVLDIFGEIHRIEFVRRKELEVTLANAKSEEFDMHYQPIIDLESGKTVGFEALARWSSPTIGEVGPGEFIALAERMACITPLTKNFLVKALNAAKAWPEHLSLSFNLSTHDLASLDSAAEIRQLVLKSGFPPYRIVMEVTETAMVEDTRLTREALQMLIDIGVRVALDDFGTGYSSLLHLHEFTFDRIKVDRSLIEDLESSADKRNTVNLLVNLTKSLGVDCVVEGVENESQVTILKAMQVDLVQGFLFARPLHPDAIEEHLRDEIGNAPQGSDIIRVA